jgi:hypothetical protein
MRADLDFDVVAQLGYVQNIDTYQKGLYKIQISLYYGKNGVKVAPVGLFSAPSVLNSNVRHQQVFMLKK